jgi:carbonic anhydrase
MVTAEPLVLVSNFEIWNMSSSVLFVSCYDSRVSSRSWLLSKSNRAVTERRASSMVGVAPGEALASAEISVLE